MKKNLLTLLILFLYDSTYAQNSFDGLIDRSLIFDIVNISGIVLVLYLVTNFIVKLIQQNLDYRLKNKIVDKGVDEPVVKQLLVRSDRDYRTVMLQWFFALAGIGTGFALMSAIRPFGLHSLAIMVLSMAAGFGGYYLATKQRRL